MVIIAKGDSFHATNSVDLTAGDLSESIKVRASDINAPVRAPFLCALIGTVFEADEFSHNYSSIPEFVYSCHSRLNVWQREFCVVLNTAFPVMKVVLQECCISLVGNASENTEHSAYCRIKCLPADHLCIV